METGRDLRCPTCGDLCPSASAGRLRPKDVVVGGESTATSVALTTEVGGQASSSTGRKVIMPAWPDALRWREQTERLLAAQLARRKEIRVLVAPLRAEDEQLEKSIAALKQMLGQVEIAESPSGATPPNVRRWSRKYDRCQSSECRTPDAKHASGGLCGPCKYRHGREAVAAGERGDA